ncbi:MAG TPA: glycoside hydrolase family 16 protein [Verrucomicrobiae bacterium]|nr:glycoside hydrolase family 16 protein [Verrucomicrobiae bacterium]
MILAVLVAFPVLGDWKLVWSDEFERNSIDTNHWAFDIGNGRSSNGWGNHELEFYTSRPENAFVSNGVLHIVAIKEGYEGHGFTSARMKTHGLFCQKYGKFELRAKLPTGQGYWPALWLMPCDSGYGGWPASGEIDVMENRGRDPGTVLGTIHFGGPGARRDQSHGPAFKFPGRESVAAFHTYALEWSTNAIDWSIDGKSYERQTNWWSSGGKYPAPFDRPFYIIINLAVGGDFGGNPDAATVFPGEMQVDYVRVYDLVAEPAISSPRQSPGSVSSKRAIPVGSASGQR